MADFQTACDLMLVHEGGFSNHPLDRGGPTKFGITTRTLERHRNELVTIKDMQDLALTEACLIYKKHYWHPLFGDQIRSQTMANMIFDQAVNRGPKEAIKTLQSVLFLRPDGIMGPETMNTLNAAKCATRYFKGCQMAYISIVLGNPAQKAFLRGWIKRTHSYIEDAV